MLKKNNDPKLKEKWPEVELYLTNYYKDIKNNPDMDNDENLWKEIDEDKLDGFLKDEEYIK